MIRGAWLVPLALLLCSAAPPVPAADAPDWLKRAMSQPASPTQQAAPAVVLVDQVSATVAASGEVRTRRLYAARIQSQAGADAAVLREPYLTDSERVREIRGWLVAPDGQVRELGKQWVVDVALVGNDVYNEVRVRGISPGPNPQPGAVFAAEVTTESRTVFSQFEWPLQQRWPVRRAERVLTLPAGWQASAVTFNHAPLTARIEGATRVWEVEDLPEIPDEPAGPPTSALAPRLAVNYGPVGADLSAPATFADWAAVSRWLAALTGQSAAIPQPVKVKAESLAAGASTPLDRVRAIAEFVQALQYVSIQTGMGRGGGYRPHPPADVLSRGHGDCKDKANLMRLMLAAIGVRAHMVSLWTGDPTYVRQEWPSPQQFDHAIVAVVLPEASSLPAAIVHPDLGPLLFFDPTASHTLLGELPVADQGGLALVVTDQGGPLVRLPEAPPEANARETTVRATIDGTGRLAGTLRERRSGQPAVQVRSASRGLAPAEFQRLLAQQVATDIPRAVLGTVEIVDRDNRLEFSSSLTVPAHAQLLQGRLLLVRAPTPLTRGLPTLGAGPRRTAVELSAGRAAEEFVVEVPTDFVLDELPARSSGEGPYGAFRLEARQDGSVVRVTREIMTRRVSVPVSEYGAVRAFVERARAVDAATIVFRRR